MIFKGIWFGFWSHLFPSRRQTPSRRLFWELAFFVTYPKIEASFARPWLGAPPAPDEIEQDVHPRGAAHPLGIPPQGRTKGVRSLAIDTFSFLGVIFLQNHLELCVAVRIRKYFLFAVVTFLQTGIFFKSRKIFPLIFFTRPRLNDYEKRANTAKCRKTQDKPNRISRIVHTLWPLSATKQLHRWKAFCCVYM